MKKGFLSLAFAVAAVSAWSQQVVVAVMPFEVRNNVVTAVDAENFTNYFSGELASKRILRLSSRADIDAAIRKEFAQQQSDWSDANKTAEIGKVLNADWLVIGVVSKAGSRIMLNISLFEMNTREQLPGVTSLAANVDAAYDAIDGMVDTFTERISGTARGQSVAGGGGSAPRQTASAASASTEAAGVESSLVKVVGPLMTKIPPKSKIAIVYVTTRDEGAAEFIAGELEYIMVDNGLTVIDRSLLDRIRREQRLQISGEVGDSQAVSIGKLVGANVIITGALTGTGGLRRLRLRALNTKSGQVLAAISEKY